MVTGASTADLAVILVDRRPQGRADPDPPAQLSSSRCSACARIVLAVNKMDLVGYDRTRSSTRSSPTTAPSPTKIGLHEITAIPISGLKGDNVIASPSAKRSPGMTARPLLEHLAGGRAHRRRACAPRPFRLPVQGVERGLISTSAAFRGAGHRHRRGSRSGRPGSRCCPRGARARWSASSPSTAICPVAVAGQSVTLTLSDGDRRLTRRCDRRRRRGRRRWAISSTPPSIWMADAPLIPRRRLSG